MHAPRSSQSTQYEGSLRGIVENDGYEKYQRVDAEVTLGGGKL